MPGDEEASCILNERSEVWVVEQRTEEGTARSISVYSCSASGFMSLIDSRSPLHDTRQQHRARFQKAWAEKLSKVAPALPMMPTEPNPGTEESPTRPTSWSSTYRLN